MDLRKIKKLIDLLNASAIGEIEVKSGDESVRISKQSSASATPDTTYHVQTPSIAQPTPTETANKDSSFQGIIEHSPMVGTVYLAKTPGDKPFVVTGQSVKAGDTLCIIEAMKVFNPIKASHSGTIEACLIEDGQPVEYDDALFSIISD